MRLAACVLAGLLVVGCSGPVDEGPKAADPELKPGRLGDAVDGCLPDFDLAVRMEFGSAYGTQLSQRTVTRGPDDSSATIASPDKLAEPLVRDLIGCVLTSTGAPARIATALDNPANTDANVGWPGMGFGWTREPIAGLSVQFIELSS